MTATQFAVIGETGSAAPPAAACVPPTIAGYYSFWSLGMATIASPAPGTGNTCVYTCVAPGPNHGPGAWVAPDVPGVTQIADFVVDGTHIQRVRMWAGPEPGANNAQTFGWNPDGAATLPQATSIVALSGPGMDVVVSPTPTETNTTSVAVPPVTVPAEALSMVVATGQAHDSISAGPAGYNTIINHTDPNFTGGSTNTSRALAVFVEANTTGTVSPADVTFAGTLGRHVVFHVTAYCADAATQTFTPIDPALLEIYLDPSDPSTWGPNRGPDNGQLVLAGARFNPGQPDNGPWAPAGVWGADDIIRSFVDEDGDDRRLWPETVGGVDWIRGGYNFRNQDNYLTPAQAGNDHGLVDTGPGKSDPLYYDGSRGLDYSFLNQNGLMRIGPDADEFRTLLLFTTEPWMQAWDSTSFAWAFHNPVGQNGSGPIRFMVDNGQCRLVSNYSATPIAPGGSANNVTVGKVLGSFALDQPFGSPEALAVRGRIDPAGSGYIIVWRLVNGVWQEIINHDHTFGYSYTDYVLSGLFFSKVWNSYDFHQYPSATAPNWDDTYGNRRNTSWGKSFQTRLAITDQEMFDHAQWALAGGKH